MVAIILEIPSISTEEVQAAARLAHTGKARRDDGVTYKHIIFGGDFICMLLAKFFNAIVQF